MRNAIRLGATPVVGFGEAPVQAPAKPPPSAWGLAVVTGIAGTATGWVLEAFARKSRRRRR